jgi:hypothetical protein
MKWFITVTYKNYLAPKDGGWQNHTGLQTCNGFTDTHPVEWLGKQNERARKAWESEKDHTSFQEILFYDLLDDFISTDELQDLS